MISLIVVLSLLLIGQSSPELSGCMLIIRDIGLSSWRSIWASNFKDLLVDLSHVLLAEEVSSSVVDWGQELRVTG